MSIVPLHPGNSSLRMALQDVSKIFRDKYVSMTTVMRQSFNANPILHPAEINEPLNPKNISSKPSYAASMQAFTAPIWSIAFDNCVVFEESGCSKQNIRVTFSCT